MQNIVFGEKEHECLAISVFRYEWDATGEYYDDNWIAVEVTIHAGSFHGRIQAAFLTVEIKAFHDQLVILHASLKGQAEFRTMEGQLALTLVGDGLGHIELKGEAMDQVGIGNRLNFEILLDQTQLLSSIRSLKEAINEYPVRT